MTDHENIDQTVEAMESIDRRFRLALQDIARDPRFNSSNLIDIFQHITQTTSEVLHCQRVSIWYYEQLEDSRKLTCQTLFNAATGEFSSDGQLKETEATRSYFNALETEGLMVMDDVATDPRCSELFQRYLPENDIGSMLDAPFVEAGKLRGVICLEHVGPARRWSTAEKNFCANMANLVTIALERHERRSTEIELREAEERYRTLVEGLPNGLVIMVGERIVFANRAAATFAHFEKPDDMLGKSLADVLIVKDFGLLKSFLLSGHGELRGKPTEYRVTLWDGEPVTLELTASYSTWRGEPAIQISFRDTTDIAYAQHRLKRSERLLSQAQRIARMGSWVWDLDKGETECSLELRKLLGLKKNPIESPISSFAHPDDAPRVEAAHQLAVTRGESYEITYRVMTGAGTLWLEEIGVPEMAENQRVVRVHGASRDITRQKDAEKRATANQHRFTALGNSFPGGLFYCSSAKELLFINETFAGWFGINGDDYIGKPIAALIGEQAFNEIEEEIALVVAGSSVTFEREADFRHTEIEALQYTLAPDVDAKGGMHGFFGLVTDITELRKVERALRQSQKMDAMGQLTGGIAHDFNNILAILMGNLELALSTSTDEESRDYITAALQGVERGAAITQKLLGFARGNTRDAQPLRVDQLITDSDDMIRQSVGNSIKVSISTDTGLWETDINAGDFQDALINLSINARDAMPDGGRLEIRTENRSLDETAQRIHPNLKAGDYVLFSMTDTGTGMDASVKDKLFEPFFSTKPEGKGTGLGMSMVFGFVSRSRGEILVYSARGEGTTIHIYLPRSQSSQESSDIQVEQFLTRQARG